MAQYQPYLSNSFSARYDEALNDITKLLKSVSNEWAKGNPDNPLPDDITKKILAILHDKNLLPKPTIRK